MAQNDPAISCNNGAITLVELLASALGKDENDNPYLRTIKVTDTGDDYITCSNNVETPEEMLRGLFGLNTAGQVALRISIEDVA